MIRWCRWNRIYLREHDKLTRHYKLAKEALEIQLILRKRAAEWLVASHKRRQGLKKR